MAPPSKSQLQRASSMKSLRSGKDRTVPVNWDPNIVFEKELTEACFKFDCLGVVINKGVVNDDFLKALKLESTRKSKRALASTMYAPAATTDDIKSVADDVTGDSNTSMAPTEQPTVFVDTLYDNQNELAEVKISKGKGVPRVLLQCISLLSPYFRFLTKLSIVKSRINAYTMHELSKMLSVSYITDICFDDSFSHEANYAILLNEKTNLRHLSLARCCINDEVCGQIASKLHFTAPAERNLMILNLSGNRITDVGAKCLTQALRTNRCLRYLNLAGNHITDEGALQLFSVLIEFPLTDDEIRQKRERYMEHLKKKRAVQLQFFDETDGKSIEEVGRRSTALRKNRGPELRKSKSVDPGIDYLCLEVLGVYIDPFAPDCVKINNGVSYCIGNMVLCALNLSYNNLTFLSINMLKTVMPYQARTKKPTDYGLMRVLVEGNLLPVNCPEYDTINQFSVGSIHRSNSTEFRKRNMSKVLKK